MNWIWVFLSFRGRLSPERYQKASSILFWVCFVPVWFSMMWRPQPTPDRFYLVIRLALFACNLGAIWPWLALTSKRLNDSGRSILLAIPVAIAMPLAAALGLAIIDGGAFGPPDAVLRFGAAGMGLLLLVIFFLLQSKIGKFPAAENA